MLRAYGIKLVLIQTEGLNVAAHQAYGFDGVGEVRFAGVAR